MRSICHFLCGLEFGLFKEHGTHPARTPVSFFRFPSHPPSPTPNFRQIRHQNRQHFNMKAELAKPRIALLGMIAAFPILTTATQLLPTGELVKAVQGRFESRSLISRLAQFSGGSSCDPLLCHTQYRCDDNGNCVPYTDPFSYFDDPSLSLPDVPVVTCENP